MKKIPYAWLLLGPYALYALGFLLNGIVVFVNGHHMPVLMPGGNCSAHLDPDDLAHSCMTAQTHLKFLADWIVSGGGVSSIGDLLMYIWEATYVPTLIAWTVLVVRDFF